MANFTVNEILDPEDNPFDRHSRISWWSQEKVSNAKVMVVGAGAIGNETLKNLALLARISHYHKNPRLSVVE